jgi:hypothetical protein
MPLAPGPLGWHNHEPDAEALASYGEITTCAACPRPP